MKNPVKSICYGKTKYRHDQNTSQSPIINYDNNLRLSSNSLKLSEIEWSFCGIASIELRALETDTLRKHLIQTGRINDL
ncbi:MAG: hypothetical protein GX627_02775 [Parcubacteria group bacterium]|nr:hypothetical protein [Parcubacteria group bacterium]